MDKGVLFLLLALLLFAGGADKTGIAALLVAVILSALSDYYEEKKIRWVFPLLYLLLCLIKTDFLLFLPLAAYDLAGMKKWYWRLLWVLPLLAGAGRAGGWYLGAAAGLGLLALLLRGKTDRLRRLQRDFYTMQDTTREKALHLEEKNRELMEKQDYEVRLATLGERNRIAREIHDHVGHLLTRALFQVRAMQVVHGGGPAANQQLEAVQQTLNDAMDNVRESVHNLHEESIDLRMQLETLLEAFAYCPVSLRYECGQMPSPLKYTLIAIVKEALSNIAKHSGASRATVTLLEHPALYQLVIEDNGQKKKPVDVHGIGLRSIRERVESFGGIFRSEQKAGFRLFVSIPKAGEQKEEKI